jgi:hypothetical protein
MSLTIEAKIECPFYVRFDGQKLVCEGLSKKVKSTTIFDTPEKALLHVKRYCCYMGGRRCTHNKNLWEWYSGKK